MIQNDLYDQEDAGQVLLPPKQEISLTAHDSMEITMTKSAVDCFKKLSESFQDAARHTIQMSETHHAPGEFVSPYIVRNETGFVIKIRSSDTLKVPVRYLTFIFRDRCHRNLFLMSKKIFVNVGKIDLKSWNFTII